MVRKNQSNNFSVLGICRAKRNNENKGWRKNATDNKVAFFLICQYYLIILPVGFNHTLSPTRDADRKRWDIYGNHWKTPISHFSQLSLWGKRCAINPEDGVILSIIASFELILRLVTIARNDGHLPKVSNIMEQNHFGLSKIMISTGQLINLVVAQP